MSCGKCAKCEKTVYQTEKVDAAGVIFHRFCFKCADSSCGITLTLKNFNAHEGKIYCAKHVPRPKLTQVADAVATKSALSAPKKTSEGLGIAQKGTGERPSVGLNSVQMVHAAHVPKVKAESIGNVHKGE